MEREDWHSGWMTRYDGCRFKRYTVDFNDSNTISNLWVTDIDEDPHGNLWIGTYGGGLNFDTGKSELKHESEKAIAEIAKLLKSDPGL